MSKISIECSWCGEWFTKAKKRITQTEKLGQQHTCSRRCSSSLTNDKKRCEPTTPNSANTRKDKDKFPEKNHTRNLVKQAVKSGKLIPLTECELCFSDHFVQGHHPDHSRPFLLIYLCKHCHDQADSSLDKWEILATDYSGCII